MWNEWNQFIEEVWLHLYRLCNQRHSLTTRAMHQSRSRKGFTSLCKIKVSVSLDWAWLIASWETLMTKHSGNVDVPADEWTSLLPVCRNLYATSYFIQQKRLGYKYHMNTLFLMRAKICLWDSFSLTLYKLCRKGLKRHDNIRHRARLKAPTLIVFPSFNVSPSHTGHIQQACTALNI